ncbi:MAG: zinc-ribbon domain-containing protein [Eubacteriaceae bacterium]|jgi:hypothetical protein
MYYCSKCGTQLQDNERFCPKCGTPRNNDHEQKTQNRTPDPAPGNNNRQGPVNQPQYREAPASSPQYANAGAPQYYNGPSMQMMSENERVVKSYQCCEIGIGNTPGVLTVTNKRLLFNASKSGTRISKELWLDSVRGVNCSFGRCLNLGKVIGGTFLILMGIMSLLAIANFNNSLIGSLAYYYSGYNQASALSTILGIVMIALGAILIVIGLRRFFSLTITSSRTSGIPISFGESPDRYNGTSCFLNLSASPTNQSKVMMNEIQALIMSLQVRK